MVRVTEHFFGCISFLCVEDPDEDRLMPKGTAFAVSVPDNDRPDAVHCYLITARHNLELARTDRIFVRVNTDGGFRDILTDRSDWQKHDSADVACLLVKEEYAEQFPLGVFVGGDFPNHFRFSESGANFPVSVGTELFFVGLFVQTPGRGRNLRIARFGHVSRMPSEDFLSFPDGSYSLEQLAYLAECGSWRGDSGSPAFCVFYRTEADGRPRRYIAFLGLISGHYDIRTKVTARKTEKAFEAAMNSGIAIVTPAEFVRELLFRDDVVEERNARFLAQNTPEIECLFRIRICYIVRSEQRRCWFVMAARERMARLLRRVSRLLDSEYRVSRHHHKISAVPRL